MLAVHLGLRYLRRRRAAWLAFAAVTLSVALPVLMLGVLQGWVEITRLQVRATEGDLTATAPGRGRTLVENEQRRQRLIAIDGVAGAAPFINSMAVLIANRRDTQADGEEGWSEGGKRADERLVEPSQLDGVDFDLDWAMGRLHPELLHPRPVLDLTSPPLSVEERGTGFITPKWREEMAFAGMDLVAGLAPIPFSMPPRAKPRSGVILGRELVYGAGGPFGYFGLGSGVTLVLPDGKGGVLGRFRAEVSDTIGTGVIEIDRYTILAPMPLAQRLTATDGRTPESKGLREIDGYRLTLEDDADWVSVAKEVRETVGLHTEHWTDRRGNIVKTFEIQRNILLLVMIAVQCICIFIIYAVFSTLVAEKRHDIGVLLGLGAPARSITGAFLLAGQAACVFGGLLGWAIGWSLLALINPFGEWTGIKLFPQEVIYTPEAPISYNPIYPLIFLGVIACVGFLATLIPAWRAGRIDPIATLRENG